MTEPVVTSSDMMKFRLLQAYRLWNQGGRKGNVAIVVCERVCVNEHEWVGISENGSANEEKTPYFQIETPGTEEVTRHVVVYDFKSGEKVFLDDDDHFSQIGDVVSYKICEKERYMITNFTYETERRPSEQIIDCAQKAYHFIFGNNDSKGKGK
ncbi:MAG: hypothetical protein J5714_03260 [Alphaproteobacteria bacterium]|nr:hypothetical protein [Alphaproteobacteria bacterium]